MKRIFIDTGTFLAKEIGDQSVSFTDWLSFTSMKRAGIRTAFGFDRHFESAGFRLWPAGI